MTQPQSSNFLRESAIALAAGALAGGVADFSVHPIDTVRTRLQVQVRIIMCFYLNRRNHKVRPLLIEGLHMLSLRSLKMRVFSHYIKELVLV